MQAQRQQAQADHGPRHEGHPAQALALHAQRGLQGGPRLHGGALGAHGGGERDEQRALLEPRAQAALGAGGSRGHGCEGLLGAAHVQHGLALDGLGGARGLAAREREREAAAVRGCRVGALHAGGARRAALQREAGRQAHAEALA
ncbi:MAG: hypothetical protein ACKOSS_08170, partial [Planctomycetia bacterium]